MLTCRGRSLDTSRPLVMAVVNATPDSFSDRERLTTTSARAARCLALLDAGADILDLGGQSGITGVPEISEDEEASRVVPLVEAVIAARGDTIVSVDTYRPEVTRAVIGAGAAIINDVSGLAHPELVELCASVNCGLVVMHTRVAPKHKLLDPDLYDDVTGDVTEMLTERIAVAVERGLDPNTVIVDPGIDYAKTPYQSVEVLRHAERVTALGRPVLWALSRKDFIGAITGRQPADRLPGTLAAIGFIGNIPGAIFRVHDVAETVAFLAVQRALLEGDILAPDSHLALDKRRER
ncbi:MAG TPA: dihydropteroate synthase [Acidimicrobiales bacterium]|nr:dihydropteroate synthase [Acidimicrobiales bacterium]